MGKNQKKSIDDWLDDTCDRICTACRHLRDLAKSKTRFVSTKLKKLMASVRLDEDMPVKPVRKTKRKKKRKIAGTNTLEKPVRKLKEATSDSSICFCLENCSCAECKEVPMVDIRSDDDISNEAEHLNEFVPAKRGALKKQVTEARKEKKAAAAEAKKETAIKKAESKQKRVTGKTTAATEVVAKPPAKRLKTKTPATEEPQADSDNAFRVVVGTKPPEKARAYIMMNNKHLICCPCKVSSNYVEIITKLKSELVEQLLSHTKEAATARLADLLKETYAAVDS